RREILFAALGFVSLGAQPELRMLAQTVIGDVVAGMALEEYDLELRRYNGWRGGFFLCGFGHSLTAECASAVGRRPWEAVRRAASDALKSYALARRCRRTGR